MDPMPFSPNYYDLIRLAPTRQLLPINPHRLLVAPKRQPRTRQLPPKRRHRDLLPSQPKLLISPPAPAQGKEHLGIHLAAPAGVPRLLPRRRARRVRDGKEENHLFDARSRVVEEGRVGLAHGTVPAVDGIDTDEGADKVGAAGCQEVADQVALGVLSHCSCQVTIKGKDGKGSGVAHA